MKVFVLTTFLAATLFSGTTILAIEAEKSLPVNPSAAPASIPNDQNLTQKIRDSLAKNTTLSTNAKSVKVMTVNGYVTLQGTVDSASEKLTVENIAKSIAGSDKVNNQLQVMIKSS